VGRQSCLVFSGIFLLLGTACAHAQQQPDVRNEKGAFIARGKWNPTENKASDGLDHLPLVEIHCFKAQNYCMQATASVHGDEPGLAVQYYQVTHWDRNGILADNEDFSCTTNEIKINFKDNSVLAVDSPKKTGNTMDACKDLAHAISYTLIGEAPGIAAPRSGTPPFMPPQP
jgi:hypothetical protein